MATVTANKAPTNNTDAEYRAWAQFIYDAFVTTATWVDTAATGSVNLATVLKPGAANTYPGFTVFRMNDALQSTYPCFVRIDYGSGTAAIRPNIKVTVGTAHDGAGTLTGTQVMSAYAFGGNGGETSTTSPCYASGAAGRIAIAMFASAATSVISWAFGIERTKDAAGADNGDGIVYASTGYQINAFAIRSQVIPPAGGLPPAEARWTIPFSRAGVSSEYNSVKAMGLLEPWAGNLLRPVLNWGALASADNVVTYSTIAPTVYGAAHTYLALGSSGSFDQVADGSGGAGANGLRLLIRYE